jgi:8-oxo-dGTP pyrophosphatase MutT (NUDIX family)
MNSDPAEYYNAQPRKATGAGVLFFNGSGELLIVKPMYLDRWLWPGGGIEEGESPLAAAIRESEEEIGISPKNLKLAFTQYRPAKPDGQNEAVHFVFTAGVMEDDFIDTLKLSKAEIEAAQFVPVSELHNFVSAQRATAVKVYIENCSQGGGLYIE